MNSKDIDEGIDTFEENRERIEDEQEVYCMHREIERVLGSRFNETYLVCKVSNVVLTGDRKFFFHGKIRTPFDYSSGYIEFIGQRVEGAHTTPFTFRWSEDEACVRPSTK